MPIASSISWSLAIATAPEDQEDDVVIAVRFESLDTQGIANNTSDIHVYKPELQPTIIGYCTVPHDYKHVCTASYQHLPTSDVALPKAPRVVDNAHPG